MNERLVQALTLAFQYVQQSMADVAIEEMATDLSVYPLESVLLALKRCRSELKTIKFSDIIDRIPGGHPGPEEAWALVSRGMGDETVTLVWTDEMRTAYRTASALADDHIAARMTFKELYQSAVSQARAEKRLPHWTVSLGYDKAGRTTAILEACERGRLIFSDVQYHLDYKTDPEVLTWLTTHHPRLLE